MIKLQTAVVILSILGIETTWALTTDDLLSRSSGSRCSAEANAAADLCERPSYSGNRSECIAKAVARLEKCSSKNDDNECKDVSTEYDKGLKEFSNACSAAQIPMSRTTGHMACSGELNKCVNMDDSSSGDTKPTLPGMRDLERESSRMDQCALLASADQDKVEKQVDKARDRKKELDNKIPEIQEKMADAEEQRDSKMAELANQQQEAAKEHAQQMKESKRNLEAVQKQLGQQLASMQEQLDGMDQQIDQLELSVTDAEAKYIDNITQIELSCHAAASQEVAKLQEIRLEQLRTNTFNRGGFSEMVKNVGVTDRQSWEREARKRYEWCMQSKPTREQKKAALRVKELAIGAAQKAKAAVEKRKVAIRQQMAQIKDQGGCAQQVTQNGDGTTNETEMCKALRNAIEDQQQNSVEYQMKQQNLQQQQQQLALTAAKKQAMLAQQLQKASLEINDEQTRLRNLEEFLALKQMKAGGSTTATMLEAAKARDAYSNFFGLSTKYLGACCQDDNKNKKSTCANVKAFVRANGGDPEAYTVSADGPDDDSTIPQTETEQERPNPPRTGHDGSTPRPTGTPPTGGDR